MDPPSHPVTQAASLYRQVSDQFGAAVARIASGYEFDPALRQDLLQEIHVALWRSLARFRGQCSLRTWTFRVAHHVCVTWIRRATRVGVRLVAIEDLDQAASAEELERETDEQATLDRVLRLIHRLKPLDRDVVLLWLEGLTAAEIGDVLGLSPAHVAQKIHRSRVALAQQFNRR